MLTPCLSAETALGLGLAGALSAADAASTAAHGTVYTISPVVAVLIAFVIAFNGSLNSWWTKIVIGVLVLIFVCLQRIRIPTRAATGSARE